MPYIKNVERDLFDRQICDLITSLENNPGQLNYVITKLLHEHLELFGVKYKNINQVIGVLECAKQELYRKVAVPYEDLKRMENGRISNLDM